MLTQIKAASCLESYIRLLSVCSYSFFTHQFCQSVDVDLPLLQSSAEEHGRRHQQIVRDPVSVNIHGRNFAAIIGSNLKVTNMHAFKKSRLIRAV